MIRSLIQIDPEGGGEVLDFYSAFGFIYVSSDDRTAPDEKQDAVTTYAGEPGEHRDGRVTLAPFDYTASFIIGAPNRDLESVNVRVNDFNRTIRERIDDSDVTVKKRVAFYNLRKRHKIVGLPDLVAVPTKFWSSGTKGEIDYAKVDLKIRVDRPELCDFELSTDNL